MTARSEELHDIIHEPHPDAASTTRSVVEAYLHIIASALLEGWSESLEELCDRYSPPNESLTDELLKVFRATKSTKGIMKAAVFINHQWVVKLGHNAELEAEVYDEAEPAMLAKLVPTVPLGDLGCVQLKVETPANSHGWSFDKKTIEDQFNRMTRDNNDVHRSNVGMWNGRLMHLDFAGA